MSGSDHPPPWGGGTPPPPGSQPPPDVSRPTWGQPVGMAGPTPAPAGGWAPQPPPAHLPGMWGAAHKPGAMPLRPLGLGDMYDAAFKIIRFNPKATAGSAVIVAAVSMAVPVLATAIMTFAMGLTFDPSSADTLSDPYGSSVTTGDIAGIVGPYAALLVGTVLQWAGTVLVVGMIAHVAAAAAIGRRLSLGETWAATRGKRWALIGMAVLVLVVSVLAIVAYVLLSILYASNASSGGSVFAWFLFTAPMAVCVGIFVSTRVTYLAPAALVLEDIGVFAAFGRAWRLTSRQFWRVFGISLLTSIVVGVAAQALTFPIGLVTQVAGMAVSNGEFLLFFTIVGSALGQILAASFTVPFAASVRSLQYLDQRMRKEAYDVELMTRAGITRA